MMILVTGVTGMAGGAVARELVSRGVVGVRGLIRSEKDRAGLPAGVEGVLGDFGDAASVKAALAGVDAAYLVCGPIPELVQLETNFLLACQGAKVGNIVINSALGAGDFGKSFPSWHRQVEDKARALGLPATILRPNGFMQNVATYFAGTIKGQNAFYGTIGSAKVSLIDVRDVASAAATCLSGKGQVGRVFELSGPEAVSYDELAGRLSRLLGRAISYVNITPEQMRGAMAGAPDWRITAILELDEYYASGKGNAPDGALRALLPAAPRTLDAYLQEIKGVL